MAQYIDKSALVAEIKRRIDLLKTNESGVFHTFASEMIIIEYENILSFLDTLEVKEADLNKEIEDVKHNYKVDNNQHTSICSADIEWLAKHFFELGLKAQKGE